MKYLITGITGFAGPHLARLLLYEGHDVYGLIRGSNGREQDLLDVLTSDEILNIHFIYGDLLDRHRIEYIIEQEQFDGVFHLAAQSHPPTSFIDPVGTFNTNVMGSINLIESILAKSKNTKLMFCSTSEVYGNEGKDGRLIKEDERILPSNPYGNSKAAIDLYMQERMLNARLKGFITRAFSHTGPRRGNNFSISSDAYQLARIWKYRLNPVLKVGNLNTTRVVMDVRDTVQAYYSLMINDKSNGQAFNVCGDTPHKMQYFTDELIKIYDSFDTNPEYGVINQKITTEIEPKFWRKHDIYYQHGDTTKLKSITNWKPIFELSETLYDLFTYWIKKV